MQYYTDDIKNAASGISNRVLYNSSFKAGELVRNGKLNRHEAETMLRQAAIERKIPQHEAIATIRSGMRKN